MNPLGFKILIIQSTTGGVEDTRLEAKNKNTTPKSSQKKGLRSKISKILSVLQENNCLQNFSRNLSGVLQHEAKLVITLAHLQQVKNSAVFEPRAGQFLRTCKVRGQGF